MAASRGIHWPLALLSSAVPPRLGGDLTARRLLRKVHRAARSVAQTTRALLQRDHPLLVHLIPMRRCNLSCAYCNEYDTVSSPVPLPAMLERIDQLGDLRTA